VVAVHQPRLAVAQDERAVRQVARLVVAAALVMQPEVDLVGAAGADQRQEAVVVLPAAQRARPVPGRERRRLVEEEQLGEAARLQQRRPLPVLEPQPAGDPAAPVVMPADAAVVVVQAAAVAVHEPAGGVRDQLAQRGDAVLQRHVRMGSNI